MKLGAKERRNRLRLIRSGNIGPITFKGLLQKYGTATDAIAALPDLLKKLSSRKIALCSVMQAENEMDRLEKIKGKMLFWGEDDYPALLAQIIDPPPVLCVLGHTSLLDKPMVAIVGTRNATNNGMRLARRFGEVMGQSGYVIVSGMARGIDTSAHEGALAQGTVAVLAGGVDNIYPLENARLHHEIAEVGAIVSEAPLGTTPSARHFPRRNRIISGLSLGVLVIEAARKSGSLITAHMALEQNREVFAVPGSPLDGRLRGTNALIKEGAILCETPDDIIPVLQAGSTRLEVHAPLLAWQASNDPGDHDDDNDREAQLAHVLGVMSSTPMRLEAIIAATALPAVKVQAALMELELCQKVECLPQAYYVLHGGDAIDALFTP
ncbi:MAG: DNA-processing protein DprA [Pseudomonadota bacterium]